MRMITSPKDLSDTFTELLATHDVVRFAVAWASGPSDKFDACSALFNSINKIQRSVVGTHFYRTDPAFIKRFLKSKRVHFVDDHSDVFHPKIYSFKLKGGDWACIVGSANFTLGGFMNNREASLLVTQADDPDGKILEQVTEAIDWHWEQGSSWMQTDLDNYCATRDLLGPFIAQAGGQFGNGKRGDRSKRSTSLQSHGVRSCRTYETT